MHACRWHVCVHMVFETHERTSLRQPLPAAERPATVAAGATARPMTCTVCQAATAGGDGRNLRVTFLRG